MSDDEQIIDEVSNEPDYHTLWLRAQADMENLRKRTDQERGNLLKFGQAGLLEELLPIVDNFDRATKAVPGDQQAAAWVVGIQYIRKNFMDVLEAHNVSVIIPEEGSVYDPQLQEALGTVPDAELPEGSVVSVISNGYMLHDRLLKPAQVTVSTSITVNE